MTSIEAAPGESSLTFAGLTARSDEALERVFHASAAPSPDSLSGWEWRGFNTPKWTKLAGIQQFIKGFFPGDGGLEGYNLRVRQTGDWSTPGAPAPFGFYTVGPVRAGSRDAHHLGATLLDYGASPRNRWWRVWDDLPMKVLRDYVVQPDPRNPDVLLGKAFLAIGPMRFYSNFFVLERLRRGAWKP